MDPDRESEVAREIAALAAFGREELSARWRAAFGAPPPPKLSKALMVKALAHELQCRAFVGLSAATRRTLKAIAAGKTAVSITRVPAKGARLVREWNGVVHEVEVTEAGYLWRGGTWHSLSAVAREITGTRWSGPRFFGLEARGGK